MQKLSAIEAERVLSVLRDTASNAQLLFSIPTALDADLRSGIRDAAVDATMVAPLEAHWRLEDRCCLTSDAGDATTAKITQEQLESVQRQTRESCKQLCRNLRKNPALAEDMRAVATIDPMSGGLDQFMEALAILRDVTYSRLSLTSDDMRNRSSQTKALLARQEDLERDQEMLEAELDELRREQEETAAVLTMDIQRLQEKVHAVKEAYDHGMRRITTTAHEEQTAASNAFAASSDDLKDQVEKLQAKLEVKLKDSASAEAEAKKRKNRYVIEIKKMQGEYDTRMADIQAAIDEMRKKHDDEVAELEKLQLHFKYVDEDLARQDAENKAYEDAKAAKRKAQMEALFSASCKIQAMIRGWYTRRRLAELMPLSKGKKKRK